MASRCRAPRPRRLERATPFPGSIVQRRQLLSAVSSQRLIDMCHQPIACLESEVLVLEVVQSASQEASGGQQHQRERRLKHDECGSRQ